MNESKTITDVIKNSDKNNGGITMPNDKVYNTIKQIEITKRAFKMLDDLNRVANNSLRLTEELVNKLSYDECIEVLSICENIPIATKHDIADRLKKQNIKE